MNHHIRSILGVDVRARHPYRDIEYKHDPFKKPIIHKQIDGKEIVPLNISKLWGNS